MVETSRQRKNTAQLSFCRICNADAKIINYGVLSCYSCKTFFRRHALRTTLLRSCRYDGNCSINIQTRKTCFHCRLQKCFSMGMSTDLIRKEYHRTPIKRSTLSTIQPLDLVSTDRSLLTSTEWTSLSNVIHAVDKFSVIPMLHQIICNSYSMQNELQRSFDLFASFYTSVRSFINVTADFRVLTTDEQRSLYDRNLHGLFNYSGTFMLRDAGIFDNQHNESLIIPLYGENIVRQAKRVITRLDFDSSLIKLMHIVFAFSTNCFTVNADRSKDRDVLLHASFRLLGTQNVYIDMIWKYMLYRYGYDQSVRRFANLIKHMLDLIILSTNIYPDNHYHRILVDDLVEKSKGTLVLEQHDTQPLWGKTV